MAKRLVFGELPWENKPLSRSEFVKEYGYLNFNEAKYQEYLDAHENNGKNADEQTLNFAHIQTEIGQG